MQCPEIFPTESERFKTLVNYGLDNEAVIKSLDPVVRMAARMFNMPSGALNIIGDDHVFFVASTGFGGVNMRSDTSFCAHAINQCSQILYIDQLSNIALQISAYIVSMPRVWFESAVEDGRVRPIEEYLVDVFTNFSYAL